jgi:molybdopterin molybdotransferase
MAGELTEPPITVQATTEHKLRKHPGRTDFQRGVLTQLEDGSWQVCDTGSQGSGMLSSMVKSNCYIRLGADVGNIEAGELVDVIPYDRWIS